MTLRKEPDYDRAYVGTPPWEIGRPQKEVVRLARSGEIEGSVLDVGCGTGENTIYLAALGYKVYGVDASPLAIEKAKAKAKARAVNATFIVGNALDLTFLQRTFDVALDSGLFQVFSDEQRAVFVNSLAGVLVPGSKYFMLCFGEYERYGRGPLCGARGVTQAEIRGEFGDGWQVNYIRAAEFEANHFHPGPIRAWLASITRE